MLAAVKAMQDWTQPQVRPFCPRCLRASKVKLLEELDKLGNELSEFKVDRVFEYFCCASLDDEDLVRRILDVGNYPDNLVVILAKM